MRVTSNSFTETLINQLSRLGQRQQKLQNQVSSGLRVQFPEDDPSAMRRVLDMQTESGAVEQYQANVARLKEQSTAAYDAIQSLKTISDRAGEIATLADGTKSVQELQIYATEVTQLIQQAVQAMNTKYQGDYLFGGTLTDQQPFELTTDSNGLPTAVIYQGNTSVASYEIAEGATLSSLPVGANTSGSGTYGVITDSRTGADFFNHLISLQDHLRAGDTAAIQAGDLSALQSDEQNIVFQMATTAALQGRMDAADTIASSRAASLEKLISFQADADMTTVLLQLNQTQTAYQAALASGAKLLNLSLLDYLS
jgi:flagellar hook-associated protein 3 FlgL